MSGAPKAAKCRCGQSISRAHGRKYCSDNCRKRAYDDREELRQIEERIDFYKRALEAVRGIAYGEPGVLCDRIVRRVNTALDGHS